VFRVQPNVRMVIAFISHDTDAARNHCVLRLAVRLPRCQKFHIVEECMHSDFFRCLSGTDLYVAAWLQLLRTRLLLAWTDARCGLHAVDTLTT